MTEPRKPLKVRFRKADPEKVPLPPSYLRDQLGQSATSTGTPVAAGRPELLTGRTLWEQPARELLRYLRSDGVEVQSPEAAVLLGDLRAALEDVEIPERYR